MLITGCTSKVEEAHRRYEFLKSQHASLRDICEAGRQWKAAAAEAEDKQAYQDASLFGDTDCLSADIMGGDERYQELNVEPDNLDAMPDNTGK